MPISKKNHIQQLAYIIANQGIKDIVVCPGSRDMPIVETLASLSFNIHRAIDERSAGFVALGLTARTGLPTAVCVTSGSAVANLLPSALEAKYQKLPLVFITADRPKEWIDQLDGQTINQYDTLRCAVNYCADIPDDETSDGNWLANREINAAILYSKTTSSPVQINIQIKEPFFDCDTNALPEVRLITTITQSELISKISLANSPLLIIGQLPPTHTPSLLPAGIPYYAESLANIRNADTNFAYSEEDIKAYNPDIVLYFGGHIVSKTVKKSLRERPPHTFIRIEDGPKVQDTFKCTTHIYIGSTTTLFDKFPSKNFIVPTPLPTKSSAADYHRIYQDFIDHALIPNANGQINLCIANSTAIRALLRLNIPTDHINIYCNRGVNGIEGSLSAAIGVSLADTSIITYLVIGDLSFFYDCNALWSAELPHNLRILLVNDGKGGIFTRLKMRQTDNVRRYVEAEHNATAEHLCTAFNLYYIHLSSDFATESEWELFTNKNFAHPILMELTCATI